MKNTVIFDLDGLLVDSEIISYKLYCDLAEKYDRHFSIEDYIHHYSGKTEACNMETLIHKYQLPVSVQDGLSFISMREKEYLKNGIALKQGAAGLLSYLKKNQYKILLASSSSMERAVHILSRSGIGAFFDYLVFGTDVKRGKPYPDIFLKACAYAKEPPENCLVLEDSEAGIQAAYSAGIDVICIPDLKTPGREYLKMAAARLDSLEDVISWLKNCSALRSVAGDRCEYPDAGWRTCSF